MLEQRRKRIAAEADELQMRDTQNKMDLEREKGDILHDIDKIERESMNVQKELRSHIIETEVDVRKAKYEIEKIQESIKQDELESE